MFPERGEPAEIAASSARRAITRALDGNARAIAGESGELAHDRKRRYLRDGVFITGNPKIAGSVAVTEIVTKILIYYLHERAWAWVPWGKR